MTRASQTTQPCPHGWGALVAVLALLALHGVARAQSVTFDFDTGTPVLAVGQNLPIDQSSGGITAHFSTPAGSSGMSVQSDISTFFNLPQMPGHYLSPNASTPNVLEITFSAGLTNISLDYATVDYQDNRETPSNIQLSASAGSTVVGSATSHAAYSADTYPTGRLSFTSDQPFDTVRIEVPAQASSLRLFLVDNVTVSASEAPQRPTLKILLKGPSSVLISWPAPSPGFVLEETEQIVSSNWIHSTNLVSVVAGENQAMIAPAEGNRFYRLVHP